jgi:F-type H+-transporting ATPase subunit a
MNRRVLFISIGVLALVLLVLSLFFRSIPQPIIEIKGETIFEVGPLPVRNTLITAWCVVLFIVALAWFSGRNLKEEPSGWQNFIETVVEGIRNLVYNTAGEVHGKRFFWVIATIMLYITISNWSSLLPIFNSFGKVEEVTAHHFHEEAVVVQTSGISFINLGAEVIELEVDETACEGLEGEEHTHCIEEAREEAITHAEEEHGVGEGEKLAIIAPYLRSVNTDLMTPLSIALVAFAFIEFWGVSSQGFFGYTSKFFNFPRLFKGGFMGVIDFFVGILELIAEVARLISFTFRLFGNMLAGEILLLVMTFLLPFMFFILSVFYGLEIFVGVIQAFVFGMLVLVFGMLAVTVHGEGHGDESHE